MIGAGITGLFTAYKLSQTGEHEVTVVEKKNILVGFHLRSNIMDISLILVLIRFIHKLTVY